MKHSCFKVFAFIVFTIFYCNTFSQPGTQWASVFNSNGLSTVNKVAGMKIDSLGNVYVAGYGNFGGARTDEGIVVKYSPSGTILWTAFCSGLNDTLHEIVKSMTIDKKGNVYITGERRKTIYFPKGGTSYSDFFTAKFSSSGSLLWDRTYDRSQYDWGLFIDVDKLGNVFVLGKTRDANSYSACTTIKYDSNGVQQWVNHYKASGTAESYCIALKTDKNSNTYIEASDQFSSAFVTLKYNLAGTLLWTRRYTNTNATGFAIDNSGSILIGGVSSGTGGMREILTVKYDSSGNLSWAKKMRFANATSVENLSIAPDTSGNCFAAGSIYYQTGTTGFDVLTCKFSSSGDSLWTAIFDGGAVTGSKADRGYFVNVDKTGNAFVTGIGYPGSYGDYLTVKYNPSGVFQWSKRYHGTNSMSSVAVSGDVDNFGNVYISGTAQTGPSDYDFLTVKYNPLTGITNFENSLPVKNYLHQNYPNPFNPSTEINFELKEKGFTELKIFDLSGKEIQTLISTELTAGKHSFTWNAAHLSSGIYFYSLSAGNYSETKKLILLK
ncbi:MAG: T9SS type A sorting domain-containing protein [Ignavibacteria bacterium]|nr:T9SS type A sorting domain-containing protein [Ignavibacteria bacterium]